MLNTIIELTEIIIVILFSLVIHENAHARVAYYLGDSTAKDMGRFSFNPFKHLDLIGILLPIGLYLAKAPIISFAKPVMVNQHAFKRPKIDMILVGLAGPFSNLILAIIGLLLYNKVSILPEKLLPYFNNFLSTLTVINLVLCAFNLIPIPPLDGSVVYMTTLTKKKPRLAKVIETYGLWVLISLVIVLPLIGKAYGKDYSLIGRYIKWFINTILNSL